MENYYITFFVFLKQRSAFLPHILEAEVDLHLKRSINRLLLVCHYIAPLLMRIISLYKDFDQKETLNSLHDSEVIV